MEEARPTSESVDIEDPPSQLIEASVAAEYDNDIHTSLTSEIGTNLMRIMSNILAITTSPLDTPDSCHSWPPTPTSLEASSPAIPLAIEEIASTTVEETSDPIPIEETAEPTAVEEAADLTAVEERVSTTVKETADSIAVEETSNPIVVKETSDTAPIEETADPTPVEERVPTTVKETADPIAVEEKSDPIVVKETSDATHIEETADPTAIEETTDPQSMSNSWTENGFARTLEDFLGSIPVPNSFKEKNPSPLIFSKDLLEFIGFAAEKAEDLARKIEQDKSPSFLHPVIGWLENHWKDINPDELNETILITDRPLTSHQILLAKCYRSIGIVESFAVKLSVWAECDPLQYLETVVTESINDALTLASFHKGCSNEKNTQSARKEEKEPAKPPPLINNILQWYDDKSFVPQKQGDGMPEREFFDKNKWNDESDDVIGFKGISQEGAFRLLLQGGFGPSHLYAAGDFYGIFSAPSYNNLYSFDGLLCQSV